MLKNTPIQKIFRHLLMSWEWNTERERTTRFHNLLCIAFGRRSIQPFWQEKFLSFYVPHQITKEKREYTLFREDTGFPLWDYRRIFDKEQYYLPYKAGDVSEEEREKNLYQGKQLSLSLLYWLQTEVPRSDGGKGYPGLKVRNDIFETEDGLAKAAYIKESRRIKAKYTIVKQDVSPDFHKGQPERYDDRVGIGFYSFDLHPSMAGRNYIDIPALPFRIP